MTSPEYNDLRVEIVDTQIRIIDLEKRVERLECELSHVKEKTRDEIINGLLNALSEKRGAKKEAEAQGVAVDELLAHSGLQDEQKRMVRAVYAGLDALFTAIGRTEEDL